MSMTLFTLKYQFKKGTFNMLEIFPRCVLPLARRIFVPSQAVAPKVLHQLSKPARNSVNSESLTREPRLNVYPTCRLLGTPHLARISGPAMLNHLISRPMSSFAKDSPTPATTATHRTIPKVAFAAPMIEPYSSVMKAAEPKFNKLGFVKTEEDEHSIIFSNGKYEICMWTERYDHPSLMIAYRDSKGYCRGKEVVMNRLDQSKQFEDRQALKKLSESLSTATDELYEKFVEAFVELQVQQLLEFVEKHDADLAAL